MALNLGNLAPDVETFLDEHKKHGYSTKTEMVMESLRALRREVAEKERAAWRAEAAAEYAAAKPNNIWADIDSDDFK